MKKKEKHIYAFGVWCNNVATAHLCTSTTFWGALTQLRKRFGSFRSTEFLAKYNEDESAGAAMTAAGFIEDNTPDPRQDAQIDWETESDESKSHGTE